MKKNYKSNDGQLFTVDEIITVDNQLWVNYTKTNTGDQYSCLLEAFSERFVPVEDE